MNVTIEMIRMRGFRMINKNWYQGIVDNVMVDVIWDGKRLFVEGQHDDSLESYRLPVTPSSVHQGIKRVVKNFNYLNGK